MANTTQRLWLVRHGETEWNSTHRFCGHSDIPLSPTGRAQARWLAYQLRKKPISVVYSSDLRRTHETAQIIAGQQARPVPIQRSGAWREIAFGAWEGLTYDEIVARYPTQLGFFSDPEQHAPPEGETLDALARRVQTALQDLLESRAKKGDIVLVSHSGPLRILLCGMLHIPLTHYWQLRLDTGSLSLLEILPSEPGTQQRDTLFPEGILLSLNAQRPVHTRPSSLNR